MDLISVVIPFYNAQDLIQKGCASVFEQDYPEVEFVLLDDCSSDNTWQCLEELKSAHPDKNIKLYRNEKNLGAGPTRNRGLELCTGEFVYFMDADDRAEKHLLSRMHQELVKTGADFVVCGYETVDVTSGSGWKTFLPEILLNDPSIANLKDLALSFQTAPWNKLARREFLCSNHIVFPDIKWREDQCWTINMVMSAKKIALVNELLYHYQIYPGSLSSQRNVTCLFDGIAFNIKCFQQHGCWEWYRPLLIHFVFDEYLRYLPQVPEPLQKLFQEKLLETCKLFGMNLEQEYTCWYRQIPWYKLIPKTKASKRARSLRNRLKFAYVYQRYLQRCIESLHH